MNEVRYSKTYVRVMGLFRRDGIITPTKFMWSNGKIYIIDKVVSIDRCTATKVEGHGKRYTVLVKGKEYHLFLENGGDSDEDGIRWFVEERIA